MARIMTMSLYDIRMWRILFVLMLFTGWSIFAHTSPLVSPKKAYPGGKTFMLRVSLEGKPQTLYTLSEPSAYLSQKALERRSRQGIAVDSTDLPVSPQYVKVIDMQEDMSVVSRSRWNNTVVVRTHRRDASDALRALPFVASVRTVWESPDSIELPHSRPKYHKELVLRDTTIHSFYGSAYEQIRMLGGDSLHAAGYRGNGMTIAVLDAGFMNVDLIPTFRSIDIVGYTDMVVPQSKSIFSEMEHGTQVLSVMAVNKPGVYVGTAPDARYWLIRCEDEDTEQPVEEDYWAAAVEFADSAGVDVINSSLGFSRYDNAADTYEYWQQDGKTALISRTASMLADKGIVLVNSAGNDGMGAWKRINFPADAKDIISVGAVTPEGVNAGFSSVGPTADGRIKPDVMAQGSPASVVTERGTIASDMGTSFAAPLVTGLVASLWQANPTKNAKEIIQMVVESGNNVLHPDNIYGYGVPCFAPGFKNLNKEVRE